VNSAPRPRARTPRLWRAPQHLLAASTLVALLGCNERASDLREWRATDHDHTENPGSAQVQVDPSASAQAVPGLEDVTIVAWSQNCTQCHGQLGRGDGPRGPMLKATNLSDPAWQGSVTDEQIAASIKLGRGAMPSFKQLPDVTIANLVKLVRMMNLARMQQHAAPADSAAAVPSGVSKPSPRAHGSAAPKAALSASAPAASVKPSAP
jgi:mono/diheme cytochrome c family protein